eukprot:TRINITY_DN55774_c0_g1_i1.p1 TRINITY_DN55774_c0_g1~~TRINITY_DN55774_c0_g1_i1.p1  ORF type:complete len:217 (+),score=31.53 TRINITY_DN55774_c0_g1_i1:38-688(+)
MERVSRCTLHRQSRRPWRNEARATGLCSSCKDHGRRLRQHRATSCKERFRPLSQSGTRKPMASDKFARLRSAVRDLEWEEFSGKESARQEPVGTKRATLPPKRVSSWTLPQNNFDSSQHSAVKDETPQYLDEKHLSRLRIHMMACRIDDCNASPCKFPASAVWQCRLLEASPVCTSSSSCWAKASHPAAAGALVASSLAWPPFWLLQGAANTTTLG